MASRRQFLGSLLAAGFAPSLTWADARSPSFLSAAKRRDGSFHLVGLDEAGRELFVLPLPGRGHAACAHPVRPEAVTFARRPGTFAIVLDCARGETIAVLASPKDRHFYGHGVFSRDGSLLFTTENAYQLGEGRIGIWDARRGYQRVGELSSGGVGPHDIRRLPGTDTLVVANGGIDTHPETGREKLNLPTMRSNLTYLSGDGSVLEQAELREEYRLSSIRHLAVSKDGLVAFACQWQGSLGAAPMLQGIHRLGTDLRLIHLPSDAGSLQGYAGSIAVSENGQMVGVTFPRANRYALWRSGGADLGELHQLNDACGIAASSAGFAVTSGSGQILDHSIQSRRELRKTDFVWDNHLVRMAV
ncbi:MAG: DUF1513 domain-containing protein [Pseudomonadota bacterium]